MKKSLRLMKFKHFFFFFSNFNAFDRIEICHNLDHFTYEKILENQNWKPTCHEMPQLLKTFLKKVNVIAILIIHN